VTNWRGIHVVYWHGTQGQRSFLLKGIISNGVNVYSWGKGKRNDVIPDILDDVDDGSFSTWRLTRRGADVTNSGCNEAIKAQSGALREERLMVILFTTILLWHEPHPPQEKKSR
jgi:hypothetical protein